MQQSKKAKGRSKKQSAAGGNENFILLNSAFLLCILSAAQNAAGRSEMGQPTVYQKHSTLPSREDDV
jgi:hypothetical protein